MLPKLALASRGLRSQISAAIPGFSYYNLMSSDKCVYLRKHHHNQNNENFYYTLNIWKVGRKRNWEKGAMKIYRKPREETF